MAGTGDAADFLGVSWDLFDRGGDPREVAAAVARVADGAGVGFPSVLFTGAPEELFAECRLPERTVPQTLVIAPGGRVTWHHGGMIDDDHVRELIAAVKGAA